MSGIEYEPATVSAVDNARSFAHPEIKALAESLMPADGITAALRWTEMGTRLHDAAENLRSAVSRSIGAEWTGAAADSATRGVAAFGNSVTELAGGVTAMFMPLHNLSLQSMLFASAVPAVQTSTPADTADDSAGAAEEAAREALAKYITSGFVQSDAQVPTLPPPFDPVLDDLSGSGSTSSNGASDTQSVAAQFNSTGASESDATGDPAEADRTNSASNADGTTSADSSSADDAQAQNTSNATQYSPTDTTHQASSVDADTPAQRSYLEDPIRRSTTPNTNSPTQFTQLPVAAGQPTATSTTAPTVNSTNRTPTTTTRPGMPGMSPAAARQRDEDTEHKIPSYLITEENGDILFGPIPKTAPPVLGA